MFEGKRVFEFGGAINFPHFPMTVGVLMMLLIEGMLRGRALQVQKATVLLQ
jgi:hypothetical protein